MTPAARLQAAAEILDDIARGLAPAPDVLKSWGQHHRFAGSGDRRAIADRVYACIRARARLAAAMGEASGRALVLASLSLLDAKPLPDIEALFCGQGYGPAALTEAERARLLLEPGAQASTALGLPDFVFDDLRATYGEAANAEAEGLVAGRAPVDLRVNWQKTSRDHVISVLSQSGYAAEKTEFSPFGLRLPASAAPNLTALEVYREGGFEIQDEGSQIAVLLAGVKPAETVVDYCAGGGGKTLALLAELNGQGRMIACDIAPSRLEAIEPRLARAGAAADLRLLGPRGQGVEDVLAAADLVFVDAPCSGSGTWRRRPETAHSLTLAEVQRLHELQLLVLDRAAKLARIGGRLVYVTCSVLTHENEATVAAFETAHPEFRPVAIADRIQSLKFTDQARAKLGQLARGNALRLSPARTHTDGFFIALYERIA